MSGFDFSNHNRNAAIHAQGVPQQQVTTTGTTIVGCLFDGGVVIAADTRATSGPIVADKVHHHRLLLTNALDANTSKNCEKLHYISNQIWCAGAGTAADTEYTTGLISSNLELHALSTGRKPRVITAMTMLKHYLFRHQGHIGAHLVVAGVDSTGAHLFTVAAHGSTDKLPYVAMGSGSLAAMSVFETQWKGDLSKDDAMNLCANAIEAGILNDLGSGSNIDLVVITHEKATLLRNWVTPNQREPKQRNYRFQRGTTAVLDEQVQYRHEFVQHLVEAGAALGSVAPYYSERE